MVTIEEARAIAEHYVSILCKKNGMEAKYIEPPADEGWCFMFPLWLNYIGDSLNHLHTAIVDKVEGRYYLAHANHLVFEIAMFKKYLKDQRANKAEDAP